MKAAEARRRVADVSDELARRAAVAPPLPGAAADLLRRLDCPVTASVEVAA